MALHTIEICAGVGMLGEGLRAGLAHMGHPLRTVAYLERETYPAACLAARIQEGSLDPAPVWSDLLTFNAGAWRGAVDGIVAGFPCQDLSLAGRRAGLDGKRSGLFFNILDIADQCGAWFLFLENVAGIASATASVVDEAEGELEERAAARVVGELAERGWHAEWLTVSASEVGASHGRERWFCFAWRAALDDARCVQRGAGHEQDRPSRTKASRNQANDRLANGGCLLAPASSTVECEFCGHPFPEHLGRYGCPNCEGTGLADTPQHRRHQGRAEPSREQGRLDAAECSGAMADAQRFSGERWGKPGDLARTGSEAEGETWERQRGGPAADSGRNPMADPSSPRQQGCELPRALPCNRGGSQAHGPTEQLRRPLFAPGPADAGWRNILTHWPEHAPALEPDFRGMVDGLAFAMDESRAQRLKCVGNGVVALQAATAFVLLARRAGLAAN